MDKKKIIDLKDEGLSNREVARRCGYDRGTVSKYWREYQQGLLELEKPGADVVAIQDALFETPKYDTSNRKRTKYTEALDKQLKEILREEAKKDRVLGPYLKQNMTNKQIHKKLIEEGFDIKGIQAAWDHAQKKSKRFAEQKPEQIAEYLAEISEIPAESIAYIDETGMDTYLYREHGWSQRGKPLILLRLLHFALRRLMNLQH